MNPRARLFVAMLSTGIVGYVALGTLPGLVRGDSSYGQLTVFNEVVRLVADSYVEPVDMGRALGSANQGLTEALDGDSAYLAPEEFRSLQQPLPHDADIGVTLTRRFAFLMVVAARPGSPAQRAGLRTGDLIKTIDGRHSRTIPVPVGERLLRGAPGSLVKLGIMRARTEPTEISVVRERPTPRPAEARRLEQGPAYVRLSEFGPQTADELRVALEGFKREGAASLVLDLRAVASGAPSEALKAAELFVRSGVLGRLSGRKYPEQIWKADPVRQVWDKPLAVLIDNGTAGAAEVLAAALADAERATLVGQRTFGRAGVQRTIALPEGGLVLTVAKYHTPKGQPIHGKGIEPQEAVPAPAAAALADDDDEETSAGPDTPAPAPAGADATLERALQVLKGPVAKKAA